MDEILVDRPVNVKPDSRKDLIVFGIRLQAKGAVCVDGRETAYMVR